MQYFYINNIKFNYRLEFQSNAVEDYWKINAPLIEYCESIGVDIPHYCYNKKLSISGNCRMCLVELENAPKPIVSCAMSAKSCLNNSKVYTNSPLVKKARENILEFLLLNHPLDCPICDQGGECDLQDQSLFFGVSKKRFYNFKRTVTDKNIGPIVKTVMTRCIHCTRCVRFASEIAGVEDLGMFGRGLKSEIGNYVNKTFQSEISGNVIDLCPVGALTSKPYPFKSRSWELKNIKSFDYSDNLAINTQVSIKNNKVIRLLPGFDKSVGSDNWISDKTRFSFDGMFSPDRLLSGITEIKSNKKDYLGPAKWETLFEEIIQTLYFKDYTNLVTKEFDKLIIVVDGNSSLEVINLLLLLAKKYSFIKLRRSEDGLKCVDLTSDFLINSEMTDVNFNTSKTCLLLNINPRYEASSLNLGLRSRYLKGDFKVFSIGSSIKLTFPVNNLGLNLNVLKSIVEGNHVFCRKLLENKSNPVILTNTKFYKNSNSAELSSLVNSLQIRLKKHHLKWNNFNVVGSTMNESGINFLGNFPTLSESDLRDSIGLYFINNRRSSNFHIKKLFNMKQFSYFNKFFINSLGKSIKEKYMLIDQNGGLLEDNSNLNTIYYNIPNTVFYESNGSIVDAKGQIKHRHSILPSAIKAAKHDWDIIRKIFSYLTRIDFTSYAKDNDKIFFNNMFNPLFEKYVGGLHWPCKNFDFNFRQHSSYIKNSNFSNNFFFKTKKTKVILSNSRLWLNDFYVGGKDLHSSRSLIMSDASKKLREKETNFIGHS